MAYFSSLPGIPRKMKWPVELRGGTGDRVFVYCRCDNLEFDVKREQLVSFPDEDLYARGLVSLKKKPNLLKAFKDDCLWASELKWYLVPDNSCGDPDKVPGTDRGGGDNMVPDTDRVDGDNKVPDTDRGDGDNKVPDTDKGDGDNKVPDTDRVDGDNKVPDTDRVDGDNKVPDTDWGGGDNKVPDTDKGDGDNKVPDTDRVDGDNKVPDTDWGGGDNKVPDTDKGDGDNKVPDTDRVDGDNKVPDTDRIGGDNKVPDTDRGDGDNRVPVTDRVDGNNKVPDTDRGGGNNKVPDTDRGDGINMIQDTDNSGGDTDMVPDTHSSDGDLDMVPDTQSSNGDADMDPDTHSGDGDSDMVPDTHSGDGDPDMVPDTDSGGGDPVMVPYTDLVDGVPDMVPDTDWIDGDSDSDRDLDMVPESDSSDRDPDMVPDTHTDSCDGVPDTVPVTHSCDGDPDLVPDTQSSDVDLVPGNTGEVLDNTDEDPDYVVSDSDESTESVVFPYLDHSKVIKAVDKIVDADELETQSVCSSTWQEHNRELDRDDKVVCERYPAVFVKKFAKTNEKSKSGRKYDIVHSCYYCGSLMSNIQTHLINKHSQEDDVKQIMKLKRDIESTSNKEQKAQLEGNLKLKQRLLRNNGDHKHNHDVLMKKKGELLVSRRRNGTFNSDNYGPCPDCLEWMVLKDNYLKHRANCPKNTQCSRAAAIVQSYVYKGKIAENTGNKLKKEVIPSMKKDELTAIAISDHLIVALGQIHFVNNLGNKIKRKNYTSYRMRLAARMLQIVREEIGDPSATMGQCLVVENFDTFARAALQACGKTSDEELKHPSVALKLGYDLIRIVGAKIAYSSKGRDEENRKEAKRFAYLIEKEWKIHVRKEARLILEERAFNKKTNLPDPNDIAQLAEYLVTSLNNLNLVPDAATFRRTVILTEARLLLYNRRRPGELEALLIDWYKKRSVSVDEADLSLRQELTEMEIKLLHSQELVEIRGKTGKKVPVLLPAEVKKPLEYLTDSSVRQSAGIGEKNRYVFASSGQEPIRAGTSLDIVKYEADLKQPSRILATNLRKHTATISQVMGLQDHELKWLTNHLGHTQKVHLTHYRATSGLIERLDIAKIMLLQEKNNVGKFAGVKLSEIQFQDLDGETNDLDQEKRASPQPESDTETGLDQGVDADSEEEVSGGRFIQKKVKKVNRVSWTDAEMAEIREYFVDFFGGGKSCPRMKDCLKAIALSKAKGGQLARRHWETIKKKVNHMARKNCN